MFILKAGLPVDSPRFLNKDSCQSPHDLEGRIFFPGQVIHNRILDDHFGQKKNNVDTGNALWGSVSPLRKAFNTILKASVSSSRIW